MPWLTLTTRDVIKSLLMSKLIVMPWHRSEAAGASQALRQASGEPPLLLRSKPRQATMGSIFRDLVRQVSFKGCRAFQLICCLTGLCTQLHTLPAPHNSSQNNQCYRGSSSCNQSKCFCLHFSPLSVYFELDCDFGLVELARQHHMNAYSIHDHHYHSTLRRISQCRTISNDTFAHPSA